VGYSRAARVGTLVFVAGTTGTDAEGRVIGEGDPYAQAFAALRKIEAALHEAGAELRHVVRTRMYVTNIDDWQEAGRAHQEFFGAIRPGATMAQVSRLLDSTMLVEIEVEAVIDD